LGAFIRNESLDEFPKFFLLLNAIIIIQFFARFLALVIYRCCVRSAMLYGSETWCLKEKKIGILRRTERAMMRAMCGVKLIDKKKARVNDHVENRKDYR